MIPFTVTDFRNVSDYDFACWVYQTYWRPMVQTAIGIVKNPMDAEDVADDCILKKLDNLPVLRKRSPPALQAYLIRGARWASLDFLRAKKRRKEVLVGNSAEDYQHYLEGEPGSYRYGEIHQWPDDYQEIVDKLPEKQYHILKMKYELGCDDAAIAKYLGVATKSVRTYLSKARRTAREALAQSGQIKGEHK